MQPDRTGGSAAPAPENTAVGRGDRRNRPPDQRHPAEARRCGLIVRAIVDTCWRAGLAEGHGILPPAVAGGAFRLLFKSSQGDPTYRVNEKTRSGLGRQKIELAPWSWDQRLEPRGQSISRRAEDVGSPHVATCTAKGGAGLWSLSEVRRLNRAPGTRRYPNHPQQ